MLAGSQPSVSARRRSTEVRHRLRFLARDDQSLTPTPEGEALLPRIRALLALAREIEDAPNEVHAPETGRVRIGYSTLQFVMRVLGGIVDRRRGIRIEARSTASHDLIPRLRACEPDGPFLRLRPT